MKPHQIRTILVPLDFSRLAAHALNHAERLARRSRARVILVHVVKPYADAFGTIGTLSAALQLEKKMEKEAGRRLQTIARAVIQRSRLNVETIAKIGPVAATITKIASAKKADIIVMGTHGASGLMENLIGSTTFRLAALSRVPVLSVHRSLKQKGYKHLIYLVRDRPRAMDKFLWALTFAGLFKTRVHVVGLIRKDQKERSERMRTLCTQVRDRFLAKGIDARAAFSTGDQLSDAAIQYAKKLPDGLVVITQDHDFRLMELFKDPFSKRLLHTNLASVLTIPPRR